MARRSRETPMITQHAIRRGTSRTTAYLDSTSLVTVRVRPTVSTP